MRKKKNWKLKFTIVTLLYSLVLIPMTMLWTVQHPIKSVSYLAAIGISLNRAKKDIIRTIPKPIKKIYKVVMKPYNRYFRDVHCVTNEVTGIGVKPKPSFLVKVGTGLGKLGKFFFSWV